MCLSHSQAPGHAGCSAFKLKVEWGACTLVVCKRVPEVRPVCFTFESGFPACARRVLRLRVVRVRRAPLPFVGCGSCAVQYSVAVDLHASLVCACLSSGVLLVPFRWCLLLPAAPLLLLRTSSFPPNRRLMLLGLLFQLPESQ